MASILAIPLMMGVLLKVPGMNAQQLPRFHAGESGYLCQI